MLKEQVWVLGALVAAVAGWTDWRSRRIPNWLTAPGFVLGLVANAVFSGWPGAKDSLLGAALGLALLLPFVVIRSLGAGDWKLVGALGAWVGPERLITILILSVLVAGAMAIALVIWKKRVLQTLKNLGHMLKAFLTFHLPGQQVSLDNPESAKVPFGVAVAVATMFLAARQAWGWM